VSNLIRVEHTAHRLGISVWTVYRWARQGRLTSIRLGRRRLFAEADLEAFIATSRRSSTETHVSARDGRRRVADQRTKRREPQQ
jgi:excisionase family DNA binding protein